MASSKPKLYDKVALVTGASRGIGRGVALQLASHGAKVYITGREPARSLQSEEEFKSCPTLDKTRQDIEDRGGHAVLVYCDHSNSEEIKGLFERIDGENNGQLDILVNNAFSGLAAINNGGGRSFFELDPSFWDEVNDVGLRNHYYCSVYAARMMAKRRSGLIVNISSAGGLKYSFNVAYGCGKAALDRMAVDMAEELKGTGVTSISLWPAAVKTEGAAILIGNGKAAETFKDQKELLLESSLTGESQEFTGKCIAYMAADSQISKKTGKILLTNDVARHYGFKDIDGRLPMDMRSLSLGLRFLGWHRLGSLVPSFIRIPLFAMHMAGYKFE